MTAISRIRQLQIERYSPLMRSALGRRLEVDTRFDAIEQYLQEISSGFVPVPVPGTITPPEAVPENASRAPRLDAPRVEPDEITTRCGCDESRSLKAEVFALQDRLAECDEGDSRRLRLMREIIDDQIGWVDEEQQEAGDYLARLRQVAEELPELREAKRRSVFADRDVTQARAVRDKALGVIEAGGQ